jgi:hypothetical protein
MQPKLDYFLRAINVVGWLFLYSAVFLYEDHEGKIQNKIVQWWIKIDDARIASHSRVEAFIQGVARLTLQVFDRVLGEKLVSFRFVGVSLCLGIASFLPLGGRAYVPSSSVSDRTPAASFFRVLFDLRADAQHRSESMGAETVGTWRDSASLEHHRVHTVYPLFRQGLGNCRSRTWFCSACLRGQFRVRRLLRDAYQMDVAPRSCN